MLLYGPTPVEGSEGQRGRGCVGGGRVTVPESLEERERSVSPPPQSRPGVGETQHLGQERD